MQDTSRSGCHKVPPPAGTTGDVDSSGDVVDQARPMEPYLLARVRFWIVCGLLERAEGGAS